MKKLTKEQKEKIKASLELLCEDTTTLDKIQKVAVFLKGMNPSIDKQLQAIQDAAKKFQHISGGDVISLSLENIPADSKKAKDKKKYLVALLANWGTLKAEVDRISQLQAIASATGVTSTKTATGAAKILATAKGPLALVTIAAAGIVAVSSYLNKNSVEITVKNVGCSPFEPVTEQQINLPGLKLPSASINPGDAGLVKLPAVDMKVNTTEAGRVKLTIMGVTKDFGMPGQIKDVTFDSMSIQGKDTTLKLGEFKTHEVVIRCK